MFEELFAASITILTFFGATYVVIAQMAGDQFSPQLVPRLHRTQGLKYLIVLGLMATIMGGFMIWWNESHPWSKLVGSFLAIIEVMVAGWVFYNTLTSFNALSKSPFRKLTGPVVGDVTSDLLVKAISNREVRKLHLVLAQTQQPAVQQALLNWLEHNDYALQEKWFRVPLMHHLLATVTPTNLKTLSPVLVRTLELLLEDQRYTEAHSYVISVMRSLHNQTAFTTEHRDFLHAFARMLWYDPQSQQLRDISGNQVMEETQGYFKIHLKHLMYDVLGSPTQEGLAAFAETLAALAGDISDDLLITWISEFNDEPRMEGHWTADLVATLLEALGLALQQLRQHPTPLTDLEYDQPRVRRIAQEVLAHTPEGTPEEYHEYLRNKAQIP